MNELNNMPGPLLPRATSRYRKALLICLLFCYSGCIQLNAPRSPYRPVLSRIELSWGTAFSGGSDSLDVELEIGKGRYELYYVTETLRKHYRVLPGERIHDLLDVAAFLGDPDLNKRIDQEYIRLKLKIRVKRQRQTLLERQADIDCFAGYNVPAQEAIPTNRITL